jgi:hypothetical protein
MRTPFIVISSNIASCWITGIGHGDRNLADFVALGEAALESAVGASPCAVGCDYGGANCAAPLAAVEAPSPSLMP